MAHDHVIAARALALFASHLSVQPDPSEGAVAGAIRDAVRAYHGIRGCAAEVGAAYGERPETAAARMRWAREIIESIYSRRHSPEPMGVARLDQRMTYPTNLPLGIINTGGAGSKMPLITAGDNGVGTDGNGHER